MCHTIGQTYTFPDITQEINDLLTRFPDLCRVDDLNAILAYLELTNRFPTDETTFSDIEKLIETSRSEVDTYCVGTFDLPEDFVLDRLAVYDLPSEFVYAMDLNQLWDTYYRGDYELVWIGDECIVFSD